ncbi:hypothetical protein GGF32_006051, partial [Allomyces javanicus]
GVSVQLFLATVDEFICDLVRQPVDPNAAAAAAAAPSASARVKASRSADTTPLESAPKKRRIGDTNVNEAPLPGVPSTTAGYLVDLNVPLRLHPEHEPVRMVGM